MLWARISRPISASHPGFTPSPRMLDLDENFISEYTADFSAAVNGPPEDLLAWVRRPPFQHLHLPLL